MIATDLVDETEGPLPSTETSVEIDRSFQLLANRRRRFCLYHLLRADDSLAVHDLAELVESSITPADRTVSDQAIEETHRSLLHIHLPKLGNAGMVRVSEGTVRLESDPGLPVRKLLAATAEVELDPAQQVVLLFP